jgi:hypothetical protein
VSDPATEGRSSARDFVHSNLTLDTAKFGDALTAAYQDAYLTGLQTAASQTGISAVGGTAVATTVDWSAWHPGNADAASLVSDGGLARLLDARDITVKGITDTTLDGIGNLMATQIRAGASVDATARALGEYISDPARAYRIANTETSRAVSLASMAGYTTAGVEQVEWVISPGACPICEDHAGENPYTLRSAPEQPAHTNCRCSYSPVDTGSDALGSSGVSALDESGALGSAETALWDAGNVAPEMDLGASIGDDIPANELKRMAADARSDLRRATNQANLDEMLANQAESKATTIIDQTKSAELRATATRSRADVSTATQRVKDAEKSVKVGTKVVTEPATPKSALQQIGSDTPVPANIGSLLDVWSGLRGSGLVSAEEKKTLDSAISEYGEKAPSLYRGANVDRTLDQALREYASGKSINFDPSSFSLSINSATPYAENGDGTGVLFHLGSGGKALNIADRTQAVSGYAEEEWITSGKFVVHGTPSVDEDGILNVTLRRTK